MIRSRTATKKCVEYAKEHGKLITFDPNLRLPQIWETTDSSGAAKEQILWNQPMITMGPEGAYLTNQNGAAYAEVPQSKAHRYDRSRISSEEARCRLLKTGKAGRCTEKEITFDPNLRLPLWETTEAAKEQILWGLAHADVVKISDEEVEFLWGIKDEKEAAEKLLDEFGIRLAMVTMGPKGAYLANQNGAAYAKCPKVKPIDTTGAGDIFGGSAVSRLLKTGKAPEELSTEELGFIGQFACTAASISTTQSGGIPSIPEEETVLARM